MLLLLDESHHNTLPDFTALHAGGVAGIFAKATEATDFVDPAFAAYRAGCAGAGMVLGAYHFARLGDVAAEAAHFLSTVGQLHRGDLLALDLEVSAPGVDPVAWSLAWLQTVLAATGVRPFLYLNGSELAGHDWTPVVAGGFGLWLAKYDGSQAPVGAGQWPVLALKQYTDHAAVPGQSGAVDADVFFGNLDQLAAYGYQGTAPAPAPAPPAPPAPPAFDAAGWVAGWRCAQGATGGVFVLLQQWGNATFGAYCRINPTAPIYGPATAGFLRELAHRAASDPALSAHATALRGADGTNIGGGLSAALIRYGFPSYLARAGFRG